MATNVYLASKPRYEILDVLRGAAAVMYLLETYSDGQAHQIINHGYLAVDFFFVLSGFVIGYAYDDRWDNMTKKTPCPTVTAVPFLAHFNVQWY